MSYHDAASHVVDVVEGVGAAIMVLGALGPFAAFARRVRRAGRAYPQLREDVGRVILLGLEVLIIADIIQTIVVEPALDSVAVLGSIVVIRILLIFSLRVGPTARGHGAERVHSRVTLKGIAARSA